MVAKSSSDHQDERRAFPGKEETGSLLTADGTTSADESPHEADRSQTKKKLPFYSPFLYRDYQFLYLINVAEFFSSTLSTLTLLQWLFEATGSGIALGGLGVVTFCVNVPLITIGGVLADEMDRKHLVSKMQAAQFTVLGCVWWLNSTALLVPWHVYAAFTVLTAARRLEDSARGVLTAACVPESVLPYAISVNIITSHVGEIVAPFSFYALSSRGGLDGLTPPFAVACIATLPQIVFPLLIKAQGTATVSGASSNATKDAPTMRSRCASVMEGLRYILGHPLLPGLYALDWGMTAVSYYRELFPLFVAELFTMGRLGLSARGAMSALTVSNYLGGILGGFFTFMMAGMPHKGRLVAYATVSYGITCLLFGMTSYLTVGIAATALCGAADAVGATMRSTVVMMTTPDHLRGRARSGHSLAANAANSVGQVYVAAMASWIGCGATMILGGVLTFAFTALAVQRIPALCTYRDDGRSSGGHDALASSDEEAMMRESIELMQRLESEEAAEIAKPMERTPVELDGQVSKTGESAAE